ncbi:hypothetical protein [Mesorhizobium sp. CAU 1741]|uniref:hypothetical protein n=1 Tax=Mesorhizobium sp. CAU 1741 TaxID=3140366 RepID=UPI00325AD6EC
MKLICTCILIAGVTAIPSSPAKAQNATPETEALNPLASLEGGLLDAFNARPLFEPDRKPPVPVEETVVSVAEPQTPEIRLLGVLTTPRERVAQVFSESDGASYSLRVGDYIANWRVAEIGVRSIVMELEEREVLLELGEAAAGSSE